MTQEEFNQVESSQRQWNETLRFQSDIAAHMQREEYNLFALLRPKIYKDGNEWCVLLGEDITNGICGFGDTPYKAILDWNNSLTKP